MEELSEKAPLTKSRCFCVLHRLIPPAYVRVEGESTVRGSRRDILPFDLVGRLGGEANQALACGDD